MFSLSLYDYSSNFFDKTYENIDFLFNSEKIQKSLEKAFGNRGSIQRIHNIWQSTSHSFKSH